MLLSLLIWRFQKAKGLSCSLPDLSLTCSILTLCQHRYCCHTGLLRGREGDDMCIACWGIHSIWPATQCLPSWECSTTKWSRWIIRRIKRTGYYTTQGYKGSQSKGWWKGKNTCGHTHTRMDVHTIYISLCVYIYIYIYSFKTVIGLILISVLNNHHYSWFWMWINILFMIL